MSSSFPEAEPRSNDVLLVGEGSRSSTVGALIIGLLFTTIGISVAFVSGGGFPFALFGLVFSAVGLLLFVSGGLKLLAGTKLAAPSVTLSVSPLLLKESFSGELIQQVKSEAEINSVTVTLICREWVQYRQGTNTRTATHVVHTVNQTLDVPRRVSPPDSIRGDFEFQIPEDSMHSFEASDNRIDWLIKVHTDVANWPDYKSEFKLSVAARSVKSEDD